MAKILKIGDTYFIEFYGNGLRFQKKAGHILKDAERLKEEIEASIAQEQDKFVTRYVLLNDFVTQFLEDAARVYPKLSVKRLNAVCLDFQNFTSELNNKDVQIVSITPKVVEDYRCDLIKRNVGDKLFVFTMLLLKEVFQYAIKYGYINDNPFLHVQLPQITCLNRVHQTESDLAQEIESALMLYVQQKGAWALKNPEDLKSYLSEKGLKDSAALRRNLARLLYQKQVGLLQLSSYLQSSDIARTFIYVYPYLSV